VVLTARTEMSTTNINTKNAAAICGKRKATSEQPMPQRCQRKTLFVQGLPRPKKEAKGRALTWNPDKLRPSHHIANPLKEHTRVHSTRDNCLWGTLWAHESKPQNKRQQKKTDRNCLSTLREGRDPYLAYQSKAPAPGKLVEDRSRRNAKRAYMVLAI